MRPGLQRYKVFKLDRSGWATGRAELIFDSDRNNRDLVDECARILGVDWSEVVGPEQIPFYVFERYKIVYAQYG